MASNKSVKGARIHPRKVKQSGYEDELRVTYASAVKNRDLYGTQ
jgi:hypothetical protein